MAQDPVMGRDLRALGVVEILEQIFTDVADLDDVEQRTSPMLRLRHVCTFWRDVIDGSPKLSRLIFLQAMPVHANYVLPNQPATYMCDEHGRLDQWVPRYPSRWTNNAVQVRYSNRIHREPSEQRFNMLRSQIPSDMTRPVELNPLIRALVRNEGHFFGRSDTLHADGRLHITLAIFAGNGLGNMMTLAIPDVPDGLASMLVAQPPPTRVVLERYDMTAEPAQLMTFVAAGTTLRDLSDTLKQARREADRAGKPVWGPWRFEMFYD